MDYARIRAVADQLSDIPDAGKVEISNGTIVIMMSPSGRHERAALRLRQQLDHQLEAAGSDLVAHTGGDVEDVALGKLRRPDLVVLPDEAMDTNGAFRAADIELVAEVVSPSNHTNDYDEKMRDYPAMGIPLYLILDPRKGSVSVLSDPGPAPGEDGPRYRARHDYAFGDQVPVGPWKIDTSTLPRYDR